MFYKLNSIKIQTAEWLQVLWKMMTKCGSFLVVNDLFLPQNLLYPFKWRESLSSKLALNKIFHRNLKKITRNWKKIKNRLFLAWKYVIPSFFIYLFSLKSALIKGLLLLLHLENQKFQQMFNIRFSKKYLFHPKYELISLLRLNFNSFSEHFISSLFIPHFLFFLQLWF